MNSTPNTVLVSIELTKSEALALAQFCKRVSFTTCERHSDPTDKEEPYLMMDGLNAVRRGLDEAGYSPR